MQPDNSGSHTIDNFGNWDLEPPLQAFFLCCQNTIKRVIYMCANSSKQASVASGDTTPLVLLERIHIFEGIG